MMLALMLDPYFKGMDYIMDHISRDKATMLVHQYKDLVLLLLLNNIRGFLNPSQVATSSPPKPPSNGLFGLVASSQETFQSLFKAKLSLFRKFLLLNANGLDPLKWSASNQSKFPNVGVLA
jgi:hypothetical protein